MRKKRILFVGEASAIATGFGNYYRELLQRLAATGKYELAELGCYAKHGDPSVAEFVKGRWKFYYSWPHNEAEMAAFQQASQHPADKGQNINQFGAFVFDQVMADFKPDIVVDIRDNWMMTWQLRSPFRSWAKYIWMPTVDAEPQQEEWIEDYEKVNLVLAYSDYGIHVLKKQSPKISVFPIPMRPGVDTKCFHPADRSATRERFNIADDVPVIGTVMRNQSRKLFPDLIDAFSLMKSKYAGETAVDKSVLLMHSSWPDNQHSYDYPRHVARLSKGTHGVDYPLKGLKNHVMQTFQCHNCNEIFLGFAATLYGRPIQNNGGAGQVLVPCAYCGQNTATPPTTGRGLSREQLAEIYNLMDLYVQCSICEGDGMPIQEAKSCGTPTLAVDYTAMREKGRIPEYDHIEKDKYTCHKGGDIIKVDRYYYEPETSCKRALPDVEDLARKMRDIITNPSRMEKMQAEARECVEENYEWDVVAKRWERVLDLVKVKDRTDTWDSPIVVSKTERPDLSKVPENLTNEEFVSWLYLNVLKYPSVDPEGSKVWLTSMSNGMSREQVYQQFMNVGNNQEQSENARQTIRAAVARHKGEEYVDETEQDMDEEWV